MIKELVKTGKTVEEARDAACLELGVSIDDINVSYEILEMPVRKLFRSIPAKVLVKVELPDAAPIKETPKVAVQKPVEAPKVEQKPVVEKIVKEETIQTEKEVSTENSQTEKAIDIDSIPKVKIAVDYLKEVISHMGVDTEQVAINVVEKSGAVVICMNGKGLGVLIGRRGETMESLSYLASLVANRGEGEYLKFGLDVGGYRDKREGDLTVLAQRLAQRVIKNNRAFAMEPMNPYERRLIHSAVGEIEGVRSESAGEGPTRHVVILSTADGANNTYPEVERSNRGGANRQRGNFNNNRGGKNNNRGGYNKGGNSHNRPNKGYSSRKSMPERNYAPIDADKATPTAPKRTERVDDMADFGFGKIDL